jgi:hypothetical protein
MKINEDSHNFAHRYLDKATVDLLVHSSREHTEHIRDAPFGRNKKQFSIFYSQVIVVSLILVLNPMRIEEVGATGTHLFLLG